MAVAAAKILKPLTTRRVAHRLQVIPPVQNEVVEHQTREVTPNQAAHRNRVVVKVEARNAARA